MTVPDGEFNGDAPGWNAIDDALRRIYGNQEPRHYGTVMPWALGGPDPITGISAFKVLAPISHWHFVTYGFSELWRKEFKNPAISGFGFELTFRLVCHSDDAVPPNFALNFLQNLGRYVFQTGNCFGVGHHMSLNGPIRQGDETLIRAVAFARDPQLQSTISPNGRFDFLQIVGLTMDELDAVLNWDTDRFLERMQKDNPLLLTDIRRRSALENSEFLRDVQAGLERDGSSCGLLSTDPLRVVIADDSSPRVRVIIGDFSVWNVQRALRGRLGHDRDLTLAGAQCALTLIPSVQSAWRREDESLVLELPRETALALAASLKSDPGDYRVQGLDDVVFTVEHVEIRDAHDWNR